MIDALDWIIRRFLDLLEWSPFWTAMLVATVVVLFRLPADAWALMFPGPKKEGRNNSGPRRSA